MNSGYYGYRGAGYGGYGGAGYGGWGGYGRYGYGGLRLRVHDSVSIDGRAYLGVDRVYYRPTESGYEADIARRLAAQRHPPTSPPPPPPPRSQSKQVAASNSCRWRSGWR